MSGLRQLCGPDNSTLLGFCPGAGYHSLWTHWGTMNSTNFQTQNVRSYAKELSGSRFYWPVSSPSSLIPPLYALGDVQQGPNARTSLIQPHAATVTLLQRLAEDWWEALRVRTGLSPNQVDDRTCSATFKHAITVARCAAPQKLRAADTTVRFPAINGRFDFANDLPLEVSSLNASHRTNRLRFQWVHLPPRYGAASIGGLFETPWKASEPGEASSRVVVGCTVQAGWVPATSFTDKYNFWTGWYPWNILFGDRSPAWSPASSNKTNGRIALGDDWLDLLTPPASITPPGTSSWRPSTIESILANAGLATDAEYLDGAAMTAWLAEDSSSRQKVSLVEAIVCSVVLDGLSRTGSHRVFNTQEPGPKWSIAGYSPLPDFDTLVLQNKPAMQSPATSPSESVTIKAEMKISGFSLQRSLASFLAMPVLLIHMAMATAHIIYMVLKRHTSGSWDTIGELIALSQNSQPAFDVLANTGAGIKHSKTYAQPAKIRVIKTSASQQGRIELLFEGNPSVPKCRQHPASGLEFDDVRASLLRHPITWPKDN
ncbi:hypothetical protein BJX61DRAFT_547755 [Aspergillus egyptiacus]|nr:hypothetical protein BJX61DRAFT_547755 [Aspergillus egyptiacus]